MPCITLIGAGPGDPELLTLKAVHALQQAKVVLYDALVNPDLLQHCPPTCEFVYVGKKPGIHQYQQIIINDMLVDYAFKYGTAVRLKGGDPFVFGRGYEEAEHARRHGIHVKIIPGISSALAVPTLNDIPLTSRGVSQSFWVVTGTTANLSPSSDLALAAQSQATVVILMGMHNLHRIIPLFQKGRGEHTAVGIIQHGSTPLEKAVFGELHSIERQIREKQLSSPAIIVIGEVVRLRQQEVLEEVRHMVTA